MFAQPPTISPAGTTPDGAGLTGATLSEDLEDEVEVPPVPGDGANSGDQAGPATPLPTNSPSLPGAEPDRTEVTEETGIVIGSQFAQAWQQDREAVWLLRGDCRVRQGTTELTAKQGIVWRRVEDSPTGRRDLITVYLEGEARMSRPGGDVNEPVLLIEMVTTGGMSLEKRTRWTDQAATQDATYRRGLERRKQRRAPRSAIPAVSDDLQTVQYEPLLAVPGEGVTSEGIEAVQLQPPAIGLRRVRIFPRSAVPYSVESFESQATTPPEQIWLITGGVNLLIDGVQQVAGPVDLSADRIVIWTTMSDDGSLDGEGTVQSSDTPLQVYLEGNIIIRQGANTVRAARAFYDARENRALMLNAELSTRMPQIQGNIRMRADEIRQLSEHTYQGTNGWISTSQFGKPTYRLHANDIFVEPWEDDWYFGPPQKDPQTGEYIDEPVLWATTRDNKFYLDDVPVFYAPKMSFPTQDPNIPIRNIRIGNDRVFGFQMYTDWNLFKLLGRRRPPNTRLDLHLDYLHKRGFEVGLSGNYGGVGRFGQSANYEGSGLGYVINDGGVDNLGDDRREITFENSVRGRLNLWDKQQFDDGHQLYTEFSWLSDRNYLEQYDERAYDSGKDYENVAVLSRNIDNFGYSATVRPRLYDFYNQSEYLPRGDLYLLSEPLGDWINWSTHSYGTYATTENAAAPFDPNDKFSLLAYEGNSRGEVFMTRHQLDTAFNLGPVKVMPYVMGEASHWGETYTGDSLDRLYGAAGVRSSLEFWKTFPQVESELFNLNGLAHKVTLFADYSYAQSNQPLSAVPWINEFDDNSQEQFRRRFFTNTFQGNLPPQFDPRFYGVRSGAGAAVTAGAHELVDDRNALTFGIQQRLQTKRGPINNQRIVNWMTLDLETTFFPQAQRDNFGENLGLYGARYNWFLGDLTTLTASAYFDTFDQAQRTYNVGIISRRSARGTAYLGYRAVEGAALRSQIVTASFSYQHSDKWISTLGTAYDLGTQQNLGQSATLTRVGESFLVHLGFNVDPTRQNVGMMLSVEPKFLSLGGGGGATQLGTLLQGNQQR